SFGPASNVIVFSAPLATPPITAAERLTDEFWRRFNRGDLAGWQARLFFNRYFASSAAAFPSYFEYPDHWPIGEPLRLAVRDFLPSLPLTQVRRHGSSAPWITAGGLSTVEGSPTAADHIDIDVSLIRGKT